MSSSLLAAVATSLATWLQSPPPAPDAAPRTRAERSEWHETSTDADVAAFLAALAPLPHADLITVQSFGRTVQGRPLAVAYVRRAAPAKTPRLRALVIANIHGGEVEGKEAVQMLLREFALGEHADLLAAVDLAFVPVFNADGNDEIDRGNRFEQNGPDGGVGRRHNSQDRDLNRDFVKLESPEVRALLRLFAAFDPHLFMDLHTTNGSHHGYHLTYCTSLNGNVDPDLASLMHERFIPSVRERMASAHGYRIFDYGNFGRGGPESGWTTFSADPRLAINYVGLRHCLSLLSEAYSYLPFADRARVTRAFVLESLAELVARRDEVVELRAIARERAPTLPFRFGHELAPPVQGELLVGAVAVQEVEGLGKRYLAKPEFHAVQAPIQARFTARNARPLPAAWAILADPASLEHGLVPHILRAHGLDVFRLTAPATVRGERFAIAEVARQGRAFQGHRLATITAALEPVERELPAGTLVVPARHPLARLAAQLLEADSDDGLATWGYLAAAPDPEAAERSGAHGGYPVLRLATELEAKQLADVPGSEAAFPALVPYLPLGDALATGPRLVIDVQVPGTRVPPRGFEADLRFSGRKLGYALDGAACADLAEVAAALGQRRAAGADLGTVVVQRRDGVTHKELLDACEALKAAGAGTVRLRLDE